MAAFSSRLIAAWITPGGRFPPWTLRPPEITGRNPEAGSKRHPGRMEKSMSKLAKTPARGVEAGSVESSRAIVAVDQKADKIDMADFSVSADVRALAHHR